MSKALSAECSLGSNGLLLHSWICREPRLLTFGAGTHYCLGTALAKVAVEEYLRAVLAADSPLELAEDPKNIPWRLVLGRSPTRLGSSEGSRLAAGAAAEGGVEFVA